MNDQEKPAALAPIQPLLDDPEVLEIMIDGYERVYVERRGKLEDVPTPFRDDEHLKEMIKAIVEPMGLRINESSPLVDVRLFDGSRVNAVWPPISLVGPLLTIRKFSPKLPTISDLLKFGSWNEVIVEFLRACVHSRFNIVVAGGTASGKTTLLNVIAGMIPDEERIITVENATELRIPQKRAIRLESRPPNLEGKGEISVQDLMTNTLRMRPDRIILGEARGGEVLEMLQAMNTGHDGGMASVHANGVRDALARLETMVTYSELSVPLLTVRKMIASAIDIITYQERLQDGTRKMLKVAEVAGMQGDTILVQDIFEFRQTGMKDGQVSGHFTATGQIPKSLERIRAAGIELPLSYFTPS